MALTAVAPVPARNPWPLAAAATAAVAALAVLFFGFVLPAHRDAHDNAQAFTKPERAAMDAASVQAVNLLSYRRAHFEQDFARALAGATGELKTDLQKEKATTLKTMQDGKIDLAAQVNAVGLESTTDKGTLVLVVVTGSTVNDAGQSSPAKVERVQMTMVDSGGKWLASGIQVTDGA